MKAMEKYAEFENCFGNVDAIFKDFKKHTFNYKDKGKRFVFIPPRVDGDFILLVAHLDTVQVPNVGTYNSLTKCYANGAGYDCRTGLNAIARLYNDIDNVAVLLTDNEEIGRTTAKYADTTINEYCFGNAVDVNLIIELDREKSDYVTYHFYNEELTDILSDMGICEGIGSYSDICELNTIGTMAINLGVGCAHSHSTFSTQSMNQLDNSINIVKILCDVARDYYFADEIPVKQQWGVKGNCLNELDDYYASMAEFDDDDIEDQEFARAAREQYGIVNEFMD